MEQHQATYSCGCSHTVPQYHFPQVRCPEHLKLLEGKSYRDELRRFKLFMAPREVDAENAANVNHTMTMLHGKEYLPLITAERCLEQFNLINKLLLSRHEVFVSEYAKAKRFRVFKLMVLVTSWFSRSSGPL